MLSFLVSICCTDRPKFCFCQHRAVLHQLPWSLSGAARDVALIKVRLSLVQPTGNSTIVYDCSVHYSMTFCQCRNHSFVVSSLNPTSGRGMVYMAHKGGYTHHSTCIQPFITAYHPYFTTRCVAQPFEAISQSTLWLPHLQVSPSMTDGKNQQPTYWLIHPSYLWEWTHPHVTREQIIDIYMDAAMTAQACCQDTETWHIVEVKTGL